MPRNQPDFDTDPGRYLRGERELEEYGRGGLFDPEDADVEPDRSVARYADEAEEAEVAEEDILEIADIDGELEAQKGDYPDA